MSNKLQIKRGLSANLPATGLEAEPFYTLGSNRLFIAGADSVLREIGGGESLPEIIAADTYVKVKTDKTGRVVQGLKKIEVSDISGIGTSATKNTGISNGEIPIIGADGKINASIVPAIAITETFVVNTQAAMLAITAQIGDVAVRTDLHNSFILKAMPATALANWQELQTPLSPVQSVSGKTGSVTLDKSDVGLSLVTNIADAERIVLSATKLKTPRKINGVIFDGSTDITISATATGGNADTLGKKSLSDFVLKTDSIDGGTF